MRTETALRMVRDRERILAEVLEDERSQGWPPKFSWSAWRVNRAALVAKLRHPQDVHRLGTKPSRS